MKMEIKKLDPQEFLDGGYLHEVNRLLLHPLGLALQIEPRADEHGSFKAAIWDYRDDPEGIIYTGELPAAHKAELVAQQMFARRRARIEETGFVVQPVETEKPTLTTTYIDPAERQRSHAHRG